MNGEALNIDPATWEAVLGPRPDSWGGDSPFEIASWPHEDVGPVDGVFWHRWIAEQLQSAGASPAAATALRCKIRQGLQAGTVQTVAVHPWSGHTRKILKSAWGATSGARGLWWYGHQLGGAENDVLCVVYVLKPDWWPGPVQFLNDWSAPSGKAEAEALSRLKARKASTSDRAVAGELSEMWKEAGRDGGTPASIDAARRLLK